MILRRLLHGLTHNAAETSPQSEDPRLRGRTYAVPFGRVWAEALRLASGALRGWGLVEVSEQHGLIRAEARRRIMGVMDDATIRIGLDDDGQTRVDVRSVARGGRGDLGANRRHILLFLRYLDRGIASRRGARPPTPTRPE